MCMKCAQNPEYRDRLKAQFEECSEELTDTTTKCFSKFLTAMEKKDYYAVAKASMELGSAFGHVAELLSLAYAKEFILEAAKEVTEEG